MPQTAEGLKVHVDAKVLERIDAVRPAYISRTAWINQALDQAAQESWLKQIAAEGIPSPSTGVDRG
jgi:hypothetical protein